MMTSQECETDDEYSDDPIRLIDFEQGRMNCVEDRLNCNKSEALPHDLTDSDVDFVSDQATGSTFKGVCCTLPVSFFQISRNIELLNDCRTLSIKVVDCNKYYWYYNKHPKKTDVDNDVIVIDDDIHVASVENLSESNIQYNNETILISDNEKDKNMSLNAQSVKPKIRPVDISSYVKNNRTNDNANNTVQQESKGIEACEESKKLQLSTQQKSQIDLKKNRGLVGLKIVQKHTVAITTDDKEGKEKRKGKLKDVDAETNERNLEVGTYMKVIDNATKLCEDDSSKKSIPNNNLKAPNFKDIFVNVKNKRLDKNNTNVNNSPKNTKTPSEITEEFKPSTNNDSQKNNTNTLQSTIYDKNDLQIRVKYFTDEVWDKSLRMAIQPNLYLKFDEEGKGTNSRQHSNDKLKKKKILNANKNECNKITRMDSNTEQIDNNLHAKDENSKSIKETKKTTNEKEKLSNKDGETVVNSPVLSSCASNNDVSLIKTLPNSVTKPLHASKSLNENSSPCNAKISGNFNEKSSNLGLKVKYGKKQKLSNGKATSMKIYENSKKISTKNTCEDRSLPVIKMAPTQDINDKKNKTNEMVNVVSNKAQNQLNPGVIHRGKQIPSKATVNYQSNPGVTFTNKLITSMPKTANYQLNPGVMQIDKPMKVKPTFTYTPPISDVVQTDMLITAIPTAVNKQSSSSLTHSNKPITSNAMNPQIIIDLNRNTLTNGTTTVTNSNNVSKNALRPSANNTKPAKGSDFLKPAVSSQKCNTKVKNKLKNDIASMCNTQINSNPTGINTASAPVNYQQLPYQQNSNLQQIPYQQNSNLQQIPYQHCNNVEQVPYQQSNNYIKPPAQTIVSNTEMNADKTYPFHRNNQILYNSYFNPKDNITTAVPTTQSFVSNVNLEPSINDDLFRSRNFTPCNIPVLNSQVPQRILYQDGNNDTRFVKEYVSTSNQQICPKADDIRMNRNMINHPSEIHNLNQNQVRNNQELVQGKPIQAFVTNRYDIQKFYMGYGPHMNIKKTGRNNVPHQMINPLNVGSSRPTSIHCAPIYSNPPPIYRNSPYAYPYVHNLNQNEHWPYGPPPPPPPPPRFEQQCSNVPLQQNIYSPPTISNNASPMTGAGSTIIGRNNDGLVRKIAIVAVQTQEQPRPMAESNSEDRTPVNSKKEMLEELSKGITLGSPTEIDLGISIFESQIKNNLKRPMLKVEDPTEMTPIQKPKIAPSSKKLNKSLLALKIKPEGKTLTSDDKTFVPHKGYSPPILPIATFEKTFEILAQANIELFDKGEAKPMTEMNKPSSNIINETIRKGKTCFREKQDNAKIKKISIDEYKKRVTKNDDNESAVQSNENVDVKSKCNSWPGKVPDLAGQNAEQDLGYDSDTTMKL